MTEPILTPDAVLRLCAAAAPAPWFPSEYARTTGAERDSLDDPLNQLRLAGLLRIGGWEAGKGQWYALTDAGRAAAADSRPWRPGTLSSVVTRKQVDARTPDRSTAWDRGEAVRAVFVADASARSPVLFTLVAAQIFVFALGLAVVLRDDAPLNIYLSRGVMPHHFGVLASPMEPLVLTARSLEMGEWWRLLSYALVHYGALHLLMNLYAHLALGRLIERMYGSIRFLVLYLLSALGGGVAAALLSPENAATAGSSGALCGLIGGFAGFVLLNRVHLGGDLYDRCRQWMVNTLIVLVLFSLLPNISWQCHLGGFVGGFVAGVLLTYHRFGTAEQRWAALLGLLLLPIAGLAPLVEKGILSFPAPARAAGITRSRGQVSARETARAAASSLDISGETAYKGGRVE